jgi:hypothetical protein
MIVVSLIHAVSQNILFNPTPECNDHVELLRLKRFLRGFYTGDHNEGTLVFNDLRFGQIAG